MNNPKATIFLTGGTGFLGSYMLKTLIENNHRVVCLVRPRNSSSPEKRIRDALDFWRRGLFSSKNKNIIIFKGDIIENNLGLSKHNLNFLLHDVDEFFHVAATTELSLPYNVVKKINVDGTKKIMELGRYCKKLNKINHISTVYVCGKYAGVFSENMLNLGQGFKTVYEKTKFEAEQLIDKYRRSGLRINIYRPSIIIGESFTGKSGQFKNIYFLLSLYKKNILSYFSLSGYRINLVPVDFVSRAIYILSQDKNTNSNFHIVSKNDLLFEDFITMSRKSIKFDNPSVLDPKAIASSRIPSSQKFILKKLLVYFGFKANIDSKVTAQSLKKHNIELPMIDINILGNSIKFWLRSEAGR